MEHIPGVKDFNGNDWQSLFVLVRWPSRLKRNAFWIFLQDGAWDPERLSVSPHVAYRMPYSVSLDFSKITINSACCSFFLIWHMVEIHPSSSAILWLTWKQMVHPGGEAKGGIVIWGLRIRAHFGVDAFNKVHRRLAGGGSQIAEMQS